MASKALILKQSQWDEILKWIPNNEREMQEERVLQYIREASAAMRARWPENNKSQEQKTSIQTKLTPEMERYEIIKNADPEKRREMIKEAERFVNMRKIKEGPIELKSAAILSENLYGRKLQLEFNKAQKLDERAKTEIKNRNDMLQSVAWLKDGMEHRTNAYLIAREHKKQLLEMINERKNQRETERAQRIAAEQKEIAQHFKNIDDAKICDKELKEERKEYMSKHEKETVIMAKQKREQLKMQEDVIETVAKIHNEGKNKIKEMIKQQEIQAKHERIIFSNKLAAMAKLRHVEEIKKLISEQEHIENVRLEKEKLLEIKDQKAKNSKEKLKSERMKDYNQSLEAARIRRDMNHEEEKFYLENRIMNDKVSQEYTRMKKELKVKKIKENLKHLEAQAKELRLQNRKEREEEIKKCNKKFEDDTTDEKFFEFAKHLMEDAQNKNRPIKPIQQAVLKYKKQEFIDIQKKQRPHEISNVPIDRNYIETDLNNTNGNTRKTKARIKYEKDERKMENVYRKTKFLER